MSTEVNYDYYSEDDLLNSHIDNVLMLKKYVDTLLKEIKSGEYNVGQIQKLSSLTESFFNEIHDDKNDNNEYKFNPRTSIVELNSDTSDSDAESDEADDSDDDSKTREQKLQLYKTKMEKYLEPGKGFRSQYSGLYGDAYDIYNDEPEFLDDDNKPYSQQIIKTQPSSKDGHFAVTPYNTPSQPSYLNSYKQVSFRSAENAVANVRQNHVGLDYGTLKPYQNQITSTQSQKKEPIVPDEQFDKLETFSKQCTSNSDSETKSEGFKLSSDIPKSKPKDKLADEFLNNNLELNNYHYLKSFDISRVNNYVNLCYRY